MTNKGDAGLRDANDELAPERFRIAHDDYHARHVGTTTDGRQFFITTPFAWAPGEEEGAEFAARYLFDADGRLLDATVVPIGARSEEGALSGDAAGFDDRDATVAALIAELGPVTLEDITIAPFAVTRHGQVFGAVLHGPEDDEDPDDDEWYWSVTVEPGDSMAFFSPWDSGEYDT